VGMREDFVRYYRVVLIALGASVAFIVVLAMISEEQIIAGYEEFQITETFRAIVFFSLFTLGIWSQWKARQFVPITKGIYIPYFIVFPMIAHSISYLLILYLGSSVLKTSDVSFPWLLSSLFHDFSIYLLLIYGISAILIDALILKKIKTDQTRNDEEEHVLYVGEMSSRKSILISSIYYITANTPSSILHTLDRKFSYPETLTALENTLKDHHFIRVHPTTIVNLYHVDRYKILYNGNYDLILHNQTVVRMNKSYTANFFRQYNVLKGEVLISK
jgi:hypothetical protein